MIENILEIIKNIPKEEIVKFINENKNLLPIIKDNIHKIAINVIKIFGRLYWNKIEEYLTDTNKVIELVLKIRPDLEDILNSEKGKIWVYENLKRIYSFVYDLIWS